MNAQSSRLFRTARTLPPTLIERAYWCEILQPPARVLPESRPYACLKPLGVINDAATGLRLAEELAQERSI